MGLGLSLVLGCLTTLIPVLLTAISLLRNYLKARDMGVPMIIIPISPENPIWVLLGKSVFIPFIEKLPFGWGNNNITRYNWRGWEFVDKSRTHLELGDVFVTVAPGRNTLHLCNADTNADVFRRRDDFPRPVEFFQIVDFFGRNVSTVEGREWQKQRKVTAPCFNDENNELVWAEAVRQASGLVQYWASRPFVNSIAEDTRTLSLHILASAGFGKQYAFRGHEEKSQDRVATGYRNSLQMILDHCILIYIVGPRFLASTWLPKKWQQVHEAVSVFKQYMVDMHHAQKAAFESGKKPEKKNLMTTLVQSSLAKGESGLTEAEIYGNMFVFNFAGHDTTSHTLAYAMSLMVANPEVQVWIREEIRTIFGDECPSKFSCSEAFPKLKRCMAVLNETLRLFPIVPAIKSTKSAQTLMLNGQPLMVPSDTIVLPSQTAIQTHPRYWGHADPLLWRPSRWIVTGEDGQEEVMVPQKGSYFPWSEGQRGCPGRKFSQVEALASLATVFQHKRLEAVRHEGESASAARARIALELEQGSGWVLLLQLLRPEKIEISMHDVD